MHAILRAIVMAWLLGALPATAQEASARAEERAAMIEEIEAHARRAAASGTDGTLDAQVLKAMRETPRHLFVPEEVAPQAYRDRPLPIGYGQTISQPYIVALMTDLLKIGPEARVLEVGTGSGYQAAVLAPLVGSVHTIEIVPELGKRASATLQELGYENVETRIGDGYYGWPEAAPFDAIVVTAAAGQIPPPLVEQLAPGGRMVIPVGGPFMAQQLMLVDKGEDGTVSTRQILPVRFVPFTRSPG